MAPASPPPPSPPLPSAAPPPETPRVEPNVGTAAKVVLLLVAGLVLVATLLTGVVVVVGQKSRTEAAARTERLVADEYVAADDSFRAGIDRAPQTTSIAVSLPDGSAATEVDYLFETSPTSGIVVYVVPVAPDQPTTSLLDLTLAQLTQRGMTVELSAAERFAGYDGTRFRGVWAQGGDTYLVTGYVIAPEGRVMVVFHNERIDTPGAGAEAFRRFADTFEVGPFG